MLYENSLIDGRFSLCSFVSSWASGFIDPVLVFPNPEALHQVFGALQFRVQAVFLPFEASHVLHGNEDHLLLTEGVFRF